MSEAHQYRRPHVTREGLLRSLATDPQFWGDLGRFSPEEQAALWRLREDFEAGVARIIDGSLEEKMSSDLTPEKLREIGMSVVNVTGSDVDGSEGLAARFFVSAKKPDEEVDNG